MSTGLQALTLVAALGCAAMAGVFFAFSAFVMAALARLPAAQAIAAMQSINVTAVRPALLTALFGTAAVCLALVVAAVLTWGDRPAVLMLAGSGLYLLGTIGLTAGYHVPRNDRLASLDPTSPAAADQWSDYLSCWTRANHVRALAALAAATAFTVALAA